MLASLTEAEAMEIIVLIIVLFAGLMSGLTLGLMFMSLVDLEVLAKSGTPKDLKHAIVHVWVWICFPVAFPISKLLDFLLSHGHVALFRRAELKTEVDLHGNEAGKGELIHDETTIIAGALELSEKTARDAMTPILDIFLIDINARLDKEDDLKSIVLKITCASYLSIILNGKHFFWTGI